MIKGKNQELSRCLSLSFEKKAAVFQSQQFLTYIWHPPCQTLWYNPYSNNLFSETCLICWSKNTIYLDNMYNENIFGKYFTCHLFCLVLQFCEALKQDSICSKCSLLVILTWFKEFVRWCTLKHVYQIPPEKHNP